jgi:hypothetical protein
LELQPRGWQHTGLLTEVIQLGRDEGLAVLLRDVGATWAATIGIALGKRWPGATAVYVDGTDDLLITFPEVAP